MERPTPVEPADLLPELSPEVNLLLARMREVPLGETAVAMSFDPSRGAER
ncbi:MULTISPECIES: hypothetical protein [unclassified Nocardioides]|nr:MULTISPECIES: hypothetical protein [unclassified Nocardioides]GAW49103.1 hypothetical protein PD653B2_1423 [Nocardioides sp. PD653-B2]GAW56738.1 hypothetical protein PD653_4176 [Nocardioides sp. PD653]